MKNYRNGVTGLLNLVLGPIHWADENNTFTYFVGDRESPVTRAYPNINLAAYLGDAIDLLFWEDFFPDNVAHWERYFTHDELHSAVVALTSLGRQVTEAESGLAKARAGTDQRRERALAARTRLRALERLRERAARVHRREEGRREQRDLDEIGSLRAARARRQA